MKYLRLTGGIILFLLLFSACVKEVSYYNEEIPSGEIVLKNGETKRVSETLRLKVTYIDDTRCPVGTVCSSNGDVKVTFQAYLDGEFKEFDISYCKHRIPCTKIFEGHNVEIINVTPYPYCDEPAIDTLDYRIVVQVNQQ